ncbi:hypothetical protein [Enterovirga sp.]|uniref:hypothetical protein n=1 Tax=Enterovirga sp. TaxID=2026350 RepID=UPI002C599F66|nr:hypothetical protein [Enterovirga sp.]HMO28390.1 hypothetical protein [Enterovirga sp.]
MRKFVFSAFAAGLLFTAVPVLAAPTGAGPIAAPASGIETIRHVRHHHARHYDRHHRRSYRHGRRYHAAPRRAYAPSQAGNARNPERPVYQQNQGQTTGGPRY